MTAATTGAGITTTMAAIEGTVACLPKGAAGLPLKRKGRAGRIRSARPFRPIMESSLTRRWRLPPEPQRRRQALRRHLPAPSSMAARSCAFLPGSAFFGLERASRLAMPASSRKRSTRSVGCAPCDEPMLDAVGVELDALAVLGQQRVPRAERLDEAAVARRTHVGNDDVVVRALLRARAGQTDFQCHFYSP